MICNYCGCEESKIVAEYARFERHNVLQCVNCGLVYLEIEAGKQDIETFYSSSEYRKIPTLPVQSAEEHFHDKITQNDVNNRISFISEHVPITDKRIIEIGSASGALLEKLVENGVKEVIGIELDEEYSKFAQNRGLQVLNNPIEELNFKEEFDIALSFHTLEHVYNPKLIINSIYTALGHGGFFMGEVPNQNDWRIQIFNDNVVRRFHYDPTHLFYYSPVTLTNYLQSSGFGDIILETVERYNSLLQLTNILCNQRSEQNVEEILAKHIFPETKKDETRLPDINNKVETEFNRIFEKAVNAELMGNCLRWIARKI